MKTEPEILTTHEAKRMTLARLHADLAALAKADRYEAHEYLNRLPYGTLDDDYRSNPEAACRKALRLTVGITRPMRRLRAIDRLLGNHGVEFVRLRNGNHGFSYSNTGDSYACTVVLFASGSFRVTSWGDIVERNMSRYA